MASPEKIALHGDSIRKFRPSDSMSPSEGVGGCVPRPRKESDASTRIAADRSRLVCTSTTLARLGSTCMKMMRASDGADGARAHHVVALAHDQRRPAQQAGEDGRVDDGDGDRGRGCARPQHRDDADGQQHDREGEEHVHHAHDDAVRPAAVIGRDEAEGAAHEERRADRGRGDGQRRAPAIEDARQDIAAELVRAEPMRRRSDPSGARSRPAPAGS